MLAAPLKSVLVATTVPIVTHKQKSEDYLQNSFKT